jgi:hypothetical protein
VFTCSVKPFFFCFDVVVFQSCPTLPLQLFFRVFLLVFVASVFYFRVYTNYGLSLVNCICLTGSFRVLMDQEAKGLRPSRSPSEPNHFLQWGSRKRLRCIKTPDDGSPSPSPSEVLRRSIPRASRPLDIPPFRSPRRRSTIHRR